MTRFVVIFTTIFFVGLPIEFLSIPVPAMETNYSDFYKKLSEDKDQYSILEIPGSTSYEFASYTLYAGTIHKKTKIDGMDFARTEKDRWSFQKSTPIIDKLLYSLPTGGKVSDDNVTGDIVTTDYTPIANSIFNFYNIRYITIGKFQTGKKFDGEEIATTTDYIENKLHFPSVYEDDYLKAFQVPDIEARGCILTVDTTDDNWSQKEGTSKSRARWAKTGAKLNLVNLEKGPINVQVNFKAKIKYIHYMNVLLNGQQVANIPFKEFNGDYTFTLNSVPSGENVIELQIEDNEHNPQTTYEYSRGIRFSQFETFIK